MSWQTMSLGTVCDVEYGTRVVQKRDGGTIYPVYGGGGATFRMDTFNREDQLIVSRFAMSEECVRFVKGKFFLNDSGLTVSSNIGSLSQVFLDWQLLARSKEIYALGRGAAQRNLDVPLFRELSISYPSLPEQRRIVAILDEAFTGIAIAKTNAERSLRNAREIFDSARQELVSVNGGGHATSLGEEIELLVGFAFKSSGYVDAGDTVRLLRGDNIIQGNMRWDDAKHWPANDVADYGRFLLREGDIVLAMDRPWVKAGLKRALLQTEDIPALLVQRTACLRAGPRLDGRYLFHLISAKEFSQHLLGVQTGVGVPHISGQQIKDFAFALPSMAEQLRAVEELEALQNETRELESLYARKLAALDELKQSLLQRAFSGAL